MLVSFQFQDRVSQILGRVQQDISSIVSRVDNAQLQRASGDVEPLDYQVHVEEMAASYTTEEQTYNHVSNVAHQPAANQPGNSNEENVTFF